MSKVPSRLKPDKPRHFIKAWRIHRGLTQERLGDRVGVTHGALSQLERGLVNYTQPMLEALADALQCEPGDLITRDPNSEIWSIWDQVRKLPPDEQKRIVAIIQALQKAA
jgi:transcriptional regulator with XRE-family HTH domain